MDIEIQQEDNKVAENNVLFEPAIYAANNDGDDLDDAMGDDDARSNKTNPGGSGKLQSQAVDPKLL